MEIEKTQIKVKCDFYGCNNIAEYSFKNKKCFSKEMHFCKNCLNELYNVIGKNLIPKPAQTPFKKK